MEKTKKRRLREDLSKEEIERLEKYGSLSFKSTRRPDMRVEHFLPSKTRH
jgi:hypothetical protein